MATYNLFSYYFTLNLWYRKFATVVNECCYSLLSIMNLQVIQKKINEIREQKVMLDYDLAAL
jgi:hypothetical protein